MPNLLLKLATNMKYLMLNICLLVLVQVNLDEPTSIQPDPNSLAHDFSGIDQIFQYVVVHCSQRATEMMEHLSVEIMKR